MSGKLRKPILVGGVGISLGLWLWESLQHSLIEAGEWTTLGAITIGSGLWLLNLKTPKKAVAIKTWFPLKPEAVKQAIAAAEKLINCLEQEAPEEDIASLKQQLAQLPALLEKPELKLAIAGGKKVGKTCLKQNLEQSELFDKISWTETEACLREEQTELNATATALAADLVLFLVAGDLTEAQWQILQQMSAAHQRVMVVLNKQDQYTSEERIYLQQQLQHRVAEIIPPEDVVTIAATPAAIKVRRQQEDGSIAESWEQPPAEITNLSDRLTAILTAEREQLLWGTTWRTARKLKQQAQVQLNQIRRERALPIIEQYQWIAAATAFANPVAALDLLATVAVSTQMLVDVSGIYQQKLSFTQAKTATETIGKLMVKLGLVELSTQIITSILKSNALTYVAGGAVQGISAAYLTRIAGLSLIEYFQEQEINLESETGLNLAKLGEKLQQVFQQNQRTAFLRGFVQQTATRLSLTVS